MPKYDHRWQLAYELATPLRLPAGSKLVVTAHYDNSKMNMHNPAPEKAVYFRDMNQSWDEMFTPFIQYSIDSQNPGTQSPTVPGQRQDEAADASHQQQGVQKRTLEIGKVVGCLEMDSARNWLVTKAAQPEIALTQATSSVELSEARVRPLGSGRYELLGAGVFGPSSYQGAKIAVKGILIKDTNDVKINVTSLEMVSADCVK